MTLGLEKLCRMLAAVLLLTAAAPRAQAVAQEVIPGGPGQVVTADLAPGHWAMDALRRAESLGLLSRPLPFRAALSVDHAARGLQEAAAGARGRDSALVKLTQGWRDRFYREFGGLLAAGRDGAQWIGIRGAAGGGLTDGRAAPGIGEVGETRTGALPLEDEAWLAVEGEMYAALGSRIGVLFQPAASTEGFEIRRFDAVVGLGNWRFSVGRQPVGLMKSPTAGLVLSGAVALDRVAVRTEHPAELPGWLGVLGPVGAEAFVSRLWDDDRHEREPFLWGGTLSAQPLPRVGVAIHRAAMFGGRGHDWPITARSVVDMLIGRVSNLGFENQIVSFEARYRLPSESWLPLTAYLEWGTEDAAGAWWDVPGRVIGLETPAIPGLEALAVGGAYTSIADHCCQNPPWYRHSAFPGNWAVDEVALGHPLGGEGWEWRSYGTFDRPREGYRLEAALFHRDRTGQNLYHPGRARSDGGVLRASWMERPGRELMGEARVESGEGWTELGLQFGASMYF